MFTMTAVRNQAGGLTLALEGKVDAGAVAEIARRIKDGRQHRGRVVLDLGEVTLMDRTAMRFVAGQLRSGVELRNCPVYIKDWISREAAHDAQK